MVIMGGSDAANDAVATVSVVSITGEHIIGPVELPVSAAIAEIAELVHRAGTGLEGPMEFLDGSRALRPHDTLQNVVQALDNVQLTVIYKDPLPEEVKEALLEDISKAPRVAVRIFFKNCSAAARADEDIVRAAIRRDGTALEHAHDFLKADKEIVMEAILQSRKALLFAHESLRKDSEVVLNAVSLNGYALSYAENGMRRNPEFMKHALNQNGLALEYASGEIQADRELVTVAVRQTGLALAFAAAEIKADRDVVLVAIRQTGHALQHANAGLRTDLQVVLEAVRQNRHALKHVDTKLARHQDVLRATASCAGPMWKAY